MDPKQYPRVSPYEEKRNPVRIVFGVAAIIAVAITVVIAVFGWPLHF